MQGLKFKSLSGKTELVNFKDEFEIAEMLATEKIICSNYYMGKYKYTIYSNPNSKDCISLMDIHHTEIMKGDLIIVPQLKGLHDFDYEAINFSTVLIHNRKVLITIPAEN